MLPHIVPYFDNNHHQIWVANNGLFSFLSEISTFVPDPFPLANDQRLITGFWSDIDTRGWVNNAGNKVYYQIYSNLSAPIDTSLVFTKTTDYVRQFFPQQRPFDPKMAITGTWYRVGAYPQQTDRLNTFQIVLATDSDRSFVFLLYHDLQWAGPGYDTEPYGQAGFNAGDGVAFEMLPFSRTKDIIRLVNESNVNTPGLFAFRVDTDEIDAGGCSNNGSVVNLRPRIGSQLGSTAVNIQGPCFSNETRPKCRFGSSSEEIDAVVISSFQAICLAPLASVHGPVFVSLSINNGDSYMPVSSYTYAPLRFGSDEIIIDTGNADQLLRVGQYITLTWRFTQSVRDTFPNGTALTVELVEVDLKDESKLQQKNTPIILAQDLNVNMTSARVLLSENNINIKACFIRILARYQTRNYAGLNTGILTVRSEQSVAHESCRDWSRRQPEPSTWNGGILPCPMTRTQAVAAGRCCYELDQQCYPNSVNSNNCWLHQARPGRNESSAVECYLSKSSNVHGASAECCYDTEEQLITRGTGAGTDDRYRPASSPVLHFFEDTLPYLQCCMMKNDIEMCALFMFYRPPRRGSNTMGESGGTWGDPHFITLDGTSYTFNGYGEYTYLAIRNYSSLSTNTQSPSDSLLFMSHIRTVPLTSDDVTVTKGFAAKSSDPESEPVSITVSRREHILIRRGNETIEFEDNIDTLFFPEMTIERRQTDSQTFILSWTIGVTIQIKLIEMVSPSAALVLNIAAAVGDHHRGRTFGLLGTYDGIAGNDLQANDGTIVQSNASLEQIHRRFGTTWAINPDNTLFYYESGLSAQFFAEQNRLFSPSFNEPQNTPEQDESIRGICDIPSTLLLSSWTVSQRTCYYDMSVTGDQNFAQTSLDAGDEILSIKADMRNPPLFDIDLPVNIQAKQGQKISLEIKVTSNYPESSIVLNADYLPSGASFNEKIKRFEWKAIVGEDHVRLRAKDQTYNLTSTHEIVFRVEPGVSDGADNLKIHSLFLCMVVSICMLLN